MTELISKRTFRALSALLTYPTQKLSAAIPEITAAISAEGLVSDEAREQLQPLLADLGTLDLYDLQERYVELFDRSRALSLHLFEHVHGESRDRGQAMVDLAQTYASRGMQVAQGELPDYLPAFLEFLSLLPRAEAKGLIGETADILRAVGDRLADRGSRYATVFAALLASGGERGLSKSIAARPVPGEENSPAAMDRVWMEEPVTFLDGPQPVKFYAKGARP